MDLDIVLTMFFFTCLVQHANIPLKKINQTKLEKIMLWQIWRFQLRNTLKLSPKKKRNFNKSTKLQNYVFLWHFDVVFHMFMVIKKTFNQYKNFSLDKTGEGNVVSNLAISAQKYPKIHARKRKKFKESATLFIKTTFFGKSTVYQFGEQN